MRKNTQTLDFDQQTKIPDRTLSVCKMLELSLGMGFQTTATATVTGMCMKCHKYTLHEQKWKNTMDVSAWYHGIPHPAW
jgi:hypothetical protein